LFETAFKSYTDRVHDSWKIQSHYKESLDRLDFLFFFMVLPMSMTASPALGIMYDVVYVKAGYIRRKRRHACSDKSVVSFSFRKLEDPKPLQIDFFLIYLGGAILNNATRHMMSFLFCKI